MAKKTLICNAQIVNEGQIETADLLIEQGRIKKIASQISPDPDTTVVEAEGLHLFPGMIDDQVHFREPGLTYKGSIHSESRAAAAGGITSFMEMPNTSPATITIDALEAKYQLGAEHALVNYSFYMGTTNDNLEELKKVDPSRHCGIKIFMGASTGNMLVDNEKTLAEIFRIAPGIVTTHCEATPRVEKNNAAAIEKYGAAVPVAEHPHIRDHQACYESSSLAVELAKQYGTLLHVLHISTAKELELFDPGPIHGKQITAEACVHFLHFDDRDYAQLKNLIKCNPAIKTAADRAGLIRGLLDGQLDIIATDHAPHTWEEKQRPYLQAPAGLPLVQDALPAILELYHDGEFSLPLIVEKTAHNVATRFKIEQRGFIREGYWADFVLVNLQRSHEIEQSNLLAKCGWSPFQGRRFRSTIDSTWVNGQAVYARGKIIEQRCAQRLAFKA